VIHAQRKAPTDLGTRAAEFAQQSLHDRLHKSANRLPVLTAWMPTRQASQ
jgi:hypothetical protein